ncbi:MAG: DUF2812 domain-containing protein [Oscillospiraceae bacterium]|nr:DUF2812 domain-containing protein [Oscillospiraceae bacterium]
MRNTVHKWFWVWDFDKEEKWLCAMAAKGKALVHVGFCTYEFEDSAPGEYIYRLELLEHAPDSTEGRAYISFLEETGAEQIGSYLRWCYFRRKASLGEFDLFSDFDSRIRHLDRILWLVGTVLALNLISGTVNVLGFGDLSVNYVSGMVNLLLAAVLTLAFILLSAKKHRLGRERSISES